jgi:membrane fusion protein (multidrug efflux system)
MKKSYKHILIPLLGLCLLGFGCGPDAEGTNEQQAAAPEKATSVKVQFVGAADINEFFTLPGSLEAWEDLTLAAEIAGPVDWIGPKEGAAVKAGQKIMTIDSVSQKANLESARVDAAVKRSTMERYEKLVDERLVSRLEYDNSVNAYESARQNLELAKIAMQKSIVTSPVDGIFDRRLVDRGEYIKAGDPVALIVQVDRLKALVDVPEKDIRHLHVDEAVDVIQAQIDTGKEFHHRGKIIHLAYKADPVTRTYLAKIEVDNSAGKLRPGMIIRIEALRRNLKDALTIPLYAVVDLDGRKVVYVEEDSRAKMRPIEVELVVNDQAVISKGLELDDHLIVKGQQLLIDGAAVKVEDN